MLGSLIQNSIRRTSTGIVHRIIDLISNWRYILVLDRLIASVSALTRLWLVATTSHLTSRLALPRCRRYSISSVGRAYVLGAVQIVTGGTIGVDSVITRL